MKPVKTWVRGSEGPRAVARLHRGVNLARPGAVGRCEDDPRVPESQVGLGRGRPLLCWSPHPKGGGAGPVQ